MTHDSKGNITAVGTSSYGYNSENFLTSGPGGTALGYDPMGRLYQVASGGATTRIGYDGLDRIAEYDGGNAVLRRYIHGPGVDDPIAWYEGSGTTTRRFLSSDERGSVTSVTDGSGILLGLNKYDEYGVPQNTNLGKFGYTGQTWMPEVGLWYYKARFYRPDSGRFMQTDPIGYEGNGPNLYAYVLNDPINWVDPLGLNNCPEVDSGNCPGEEAGVIGVRTIPGGAALLRSGSGGFRGGGGGQVASPIERITRKIVCAITTFSGSADIAGGFGPVLKGSIGLDYNQKTGQLTFQASYSVGFGVAASLGFGGSMSNSERTAGYSRSTNLAASILGGLSGSWSSSNSLSGSLSVGKFGFEASRTETKTFVKKLYVADKGAKCPRGE